VGATLWCWSPAWPHHAQHIAVEFVHPVIVGKRALPAEAVEGDDVTAVLRTLVAPGDVIVAVAPGSDATVASVLRRAPAWGATTMWLGAGPRPTPGAADHVLWLDAPEGVWSGDLVLMYHLLWELAHVCFEHPGLLREEECSDEVCITCSDQARLGEVLTSDGTGLATVRTASGAEAVETTLVGPVQAGDLVLVHAGTAIGRVDECQVDQ
jgi:hydrogenase maturation factor